MIEQPRTRQPDETLCFRCNSVVKRDVESCPNCGSRIASGPSHAAATPLQIKGRGKYPGVAPRQVEAPSEGVPPQVEVPSGPAPVAGEDIVGAGRYILNFILAGIIGLVLTYVMRRQGWLATWICIPIFILVVIIFASTR